MSAGGLIMSAHRVKKRLLTASAKTEGIKNSPSKAALAMTRHLTTADIACERSARIRIHTTFNMRIAPAIERLSTNQRAPSRYDWKANSNNCGTQVIAESRISSTDIFPNTYSARENGRHK